MKQRKDQVSPKREEEDENVHFTDFVSDMQRKDKIREIRSVFDDNDQMFLLF